jgi:hypothetical protein|tara:strand:+ start:5027 stop:5182 length:156 start_codon:yes stop_codon:yes gene_type:complete
MFQDKLADEADWKDGMNMFRSRVIEQLDGILEVLDILEQEITKLNNKENTP